MEKQTSKTSFQVFMARPATRFIVGLLCLALAYAFISWAIDSGSLLDYALAVLLALAGARELIDATRQRSKK